MTNYNSINVAFESGGGVTNMTASARTFKTGSFGFGAYGKIQLDGKRYQVSLNLVEVGSKPGASDLVA